MGYIKKLKNNELVGGTDKTTIYPVTSTKAVFEEVTEGDKSSFKSQETINGDYDDRIKGLENEMPDTVKSITINGGTEHTVDESGNVDLTIYTVKPDDPDVPAMAELVEKNRDDIADIKEEIGTDTTENTLSGRIKSLENAVGTGGSVDQRIEDAINDLDSQIAVNYGNANLHIRGTVQLADGKLTRFELEENDIASASDLQALDEYTHSIYQTKIEAVSTRPATGEAGIIYRVPNSGGTTYTDWMYSNGWKELATFNIATLSASDIKYDNSTSGLTSIDVQGALDELEEQINTHETIDLNDYDTYNQYLIDGTEHWQTNAVGYACKIIPVTGGGKYKMVGSANITQYAILAAGDTHQNNTQAVYATGSSRVNISANATVYIDIPSDGVSIYIRILKEPNIDTTPSLFEKLIPVVELAEKNAEDIEELQNDLKTLGVNVYQPNNYQQVHENYQYFDITTTATSIEFKVKQSGSAWNGLYFPTLVVGKEYEIHFDCNAEWDGVLNIRDSSYNSLWRFPFSVGSTEHTDRFTYSSDMWAFTVYMPSGVSVGKKCTLTNFYVKEVLPLKDAVSENTEDIAEIKAKMSSTDITSMFTLIDKGGIAIDNNGKYFNQNAWTSWAATQAFVDISSYKYLYLSVPNRNNTLGIGFYSSASESSYVTGLRETKSGNEDIRYVLLDVSQYNYIRVTYWSSSKVSELGVDAFSCLAYTDAPLATLDTAKNVAKESVSRPIFIAASDASYEDKQAADFVCTGTDDQIVIQTAINGCGEVADIKLSAGTFHFDTFTASSDDSPSYFVIMQPNGSTEQWGSQFTKLRISSDERRFTQIVIGQSCYDSMDSDELYAVFRGRSYNGTPLYMQSLEIRNLTVMLPNNKKNIICVDFFDVGEGDCIDCIFRVPSITREYTANEIGVEYCTAIRGFCGSNNGTHQSIENVVAWGMGVGFHFGGERLVCINSGAIACAYACKINWYDNPGPAGPFSNVHPILLINFADEWSANFPQFGNQVGKQAVTMLSFNLEYDYRKFAYAGQGNKMKEKVAGSFRGYIDFTMESTNTLQNMTDVKLWEDGYGNGMRTINDAQLQACDTTTRLSYAPTYMQKIFDTTLGKEVICIDTATPTWVDAMGNTVQ